MWRAARLLSDETYDSCACAALSNIHVDYASCTVIAEVIYLVINACTRIVRFTNKDFYKRL